MKNLSLAIFICVCACISFIANSQEPQTAHTLKLSQVENQQKSSINEMDWLSGSWISIDEKQMSEEIWSHPASDSMMGMFRFISDNSVIFYELCQIVEANNSLILKLKHFNADLTGWETKDQTVDFPLIKIENQTAYFSGLTYQRIANNLNVWVAMKQKDGSFKEAEFKFVLKAPI